MDNLLLKRVRVVPETGQPPEVPFANGMDLERRLLGKFKCRLISRVGIFYCILAGELAITGVIHGHSIPA
jgi:hypothetical protein